MRQVLVYILFQEASVFPSSEQELLALEERIGYVSTALSEEQFAKCIRRRLYRPVAAKGNRSVIDDIKCSICQVNMYNWVLLFLHGINKIKTILDLLAIKVQ